MTLTQRVTAVWRLVTSKASFRALLYLTLLFWASLALLGLAGLSTALFFRHYLPIQSVTWPVYLQYSTGHHPFGLAMIDTAQLKTQQDYDVLVNLVVPPSPPNAHQGNFMVTAHLLPNAQTVDELLSKPTAGGANTGGRASTAGIVDAPETRKANVYAGGAQAHEIVQTVLQDSLLYARRPVLFPYQDPLTSLVYRIVLLPYHLLFPDSQAWHVVTRVAERARFAQAERFPRSVYVELETGPSLQVYEASVTLTAQLRGLRWLMYHYRVSMFLVATAVFWSWEVTFMVLVWSYCVQVGQRPVRTRVPSSQGPVYDGDERPSARTYGGGKAKKEQDGHGDVNNPYRFPPYRSTADDSREDLGQSSHSYDQSSHRYDQSHGHSYDHVHGHRGRGPSDPGESPEEGEDVVTPRRLSPMLTATGAEANVERDSGEEADAESGNETEAHRVDTSSVDLDRRGKLLSSASCTVDSSSSSSGRPSVDVATKASSRHLPTGDLRHRKPEGHTSAQADTPPDSHTNTEKSTPSTQGSPRESTRRGTQGSSLGSSQYEDAETHWET